MKFTDKVSAAKKFAGINTCRSTATETLDQRRALRHATRLAARVVIADVLEAKTITQIPHTAAEAIVDALEVAGYRIVTTRPTSRRSTSPSTPPQPPPPRRSRPRRPS